MAQHQTPRSQASRSCPTLLLRPEQRAPIGDGVKDLRPLTRAPCRALLDPVAYLDALPTGGEARTKDQLCEFGVDRPRSYRDDQ